MNKEKPKQFDEVLAFDGKWTEPKRQPKEWYNIDYLTYDYYYYYYYVDNNNKKDGYIYRTEKANVGEEETEQEDIITLNGVKYKRIEE